jgi:hypothetical protein
VRAGGRFATKLDKLYTKSHRIEFPHSIPFRKRDTTREDFSRAAARSGTRFRLPLGVAIWILSSLHVCSSAVYRHTTIAEQMPKSHYAHLEWSPSRLIHWAEGIGLATAAVVRTILERKPHPEMGYRASLGILRLEKIYSKACLEAASQRVVQLQSFSYQSLT